MRDNAKDRVFSLNEEINGEFYYLIRVPAYNLKTDKKKHNHIIEEFFRLAKIKKTTKYIPSKELISLNRVLL